MDGSARRCRSAWQILVGLLFCGTFCAEDAARAQTSASGKGQSQDRSQDRNGGAMAQSDTDRRGADAPGGRIQDPGRADPAPKRAQRGLSRILTPDGREATPTPRSSWAATGTRHRAWAHRRHCSLAHAPRPDHPTNSGRPRPGQRIPQWAATVRTSLSPCSRADQAA